MLGDEANIPERIEIALRTTVDLDDISFQTFNDKVVLDRLYQEFKADHCQDDAKRMARTAFITLLISQLRTGQQSMN